MKIQAKNQDIKSMKLSVPVDGLIEIDEKGIAEVSEKCGKMLIEGTSDWKEFKAGKGTVKADEDGEQDAEDVEEPETEYAEDTEDTDEAEDAKKPATDKEIIAGLNKLPLEACIETAKEAGYPEAEWEKLIKNEKAAEKLMQKYLVRKYKDSIKK